MGPIGIFFGLVVSTVFSLAYGVSHATGSFVAWTEYDPWSPGRPEKHRQFYFHQDGTGQIFEAVNEQIVKLGETDQSLFFRSLYLDRIFDLNEPLEAPKSRSSIVEGRGNKIYLVVSDAGRLKFITADAKFLSPVLEDLRRRLVEPPTRNLASFVSITLLPPTFKPSAEESSQMILLSESVQDQFPEINKALVAPFKLISMSDIRWNMLNKLLGSSGIQLYAKTIKNDMVKLQYHPFQ
jgi:hypothetical protein